MPAYNIVDHTYDVVGSMFPTKEMGGGSGLKYAATTIVYLSKRKEKDSDGDVVGNVIHCKLYKGRITKENKMVDVLLKYDSGLDRYYGLVDLALKYGIFKKVSTRIELPDGKTAFEKNIRENPEKFFTEEVMKKLEEAAACLGATRWQIFSRVIFPSIAPALLTGFAMAFARAIGEYGSVIFIAGNMPMVSEITPLLIISKLEQYDYAGATAVAVVMLIISFVLLLIINALQAWQRKQTGAAA